MSIQWIAKVVIAALLITGTAAATPELSEYGVQPQPTDSGAAVVTTVTEEDAVTIALEQAGMTADAVTELQTEFDPDDPIPHWEVEFHNGDWEYEITVDKDGAVPEQEKEPEKEPEDLPVTPQPPAPTAEPEAKDLTEQQALTVALEHAGLTAQQIRHLQIERDTEDGVPVWEIEFQNDGWEYEYEIHALSGKILKGEKEYDD